MENTKDIWIEGIIYEKRILVRNVILYNNQSRKDKKGNKKKQKEKQTKGKTKRKTSKKIQSFLS